MGVQSHHASIAIQKGVDGLELNMGEGGPQEDGQSRGFIMQKALQRGHDPRRASPGVVEPDQSAIALTAVAARLADASDYARLYDYSAFVRGYEIAAPAGWGARS